MTSKQCTATTAAGRPCRAWAMHDRTLCATHAGRTTNAGAPPGSSNPTTHGFYGSTYTMDEIVDLVAHASNDSLDDEIAAARVAIRRIMEILAADKRATTTDKGQLLTQDYSQMAGLIFTGANTIARLLRAQRSLSGESSDGIAGAIAQALDGLADEWSIDL